MSDLDPRLQSALAAVEASPDDLGLWDELEDIAAKLQKPDEVGQLYRDVLARNLTAAQVAAIGPRASGFHEEWFGEESPYLAEVLTRVLTLDPRADWALARVTVLLTVREKWNDLLGLYDRALAAAEDSYRKTQLLEEAVQLAKDFAGQPDRAIGYLAELSSLRPNDAQLKVSLERLLERQGRHEELIALWRKGDDAETAERRLQIARTYLDDIGNAGAALEEARALLAAGQASTEATALVERVLALETASPEVRREALNELRDRYKDAGKPADYERVTRAALAFSTGPDKVALHRELANMAESAGQPEAALEQWAALLALDPSDGEAEDRLAKVAEQIGAHGPLADALEVAAAAASSGSRRNELLVAAGDVRARTDRAAAEALYRRVLDAEGASAARRLEVARRLASLLGAATDRRQDLLALLEQLATLEQDAGERRRALGSAARLAAELGERDRALASWDRRLAADPGDLEALEAKSHLLAELGRHADRATTLAARAALPLPPAVRRTDLVEIARIQEIELGDASAAIVTWRGIADEFGETNESVDALSRLYDATGAHTDKNELLDRASKRDAERAVQMLVRLAALRAGPLGDVDSAARLYHEAIRLDPGHAGARGGLATLIEVPSAKAGAVEGLAEAARRTDDVDALLGLLPNRLEAAGNDARGRVRLLREAAQLEEQRKNDQGRAFEHVRDAFTLTPEDDALEREMMRLASASGRDKEAATALAAASGTLSNDPLRALALAKRAADQFEALGAGAEALEAARAAFALQPKDTGVAVQLVRLAAAAGDFTTVAHTLVDSSFALRAIEEPLLAAVEASAEAKGAWDALAAATEPALEAEAGRLSATEARAASDLLRGFFVRLATWHRDRRGDLEKAETLLARALAFDPAHQETLRELARLSWRAPGKRLVDTLLALADQLPGDLDTLFDAAKIAEENLKDPVLTREILGRLQRTATRLWLKGEPARGERPADKTALDALSALVRLETEAGRIAHAIDWLVEGSRLPLPPAESRALLRRAGDLAMSKLNDEARAMRLYQQVIEDTLEDGEVVDRLAKTYEARGRVPELLALRKRELELELPADRKLVVRLEVARLLGHLEDKGGRVEMLRANLSDQPGHQDSIAEVTSVLEGKGRSAELADLLGGQARRLEDQDPARAAGLWSRVAKIGEEQLRDTERALQAYRRVVGLAPSIDALEALSRIHLGRNEPALAAEWLEKQLDATKGVEARNQVALRLADARLAAGRTDRAILALERAVGEDPTSSTARDRLADLYRKSGKQLELANLLRDGATHATGDVQAAYVKEAAGLYRELGVSEHAIGMLEAARQRGEIDQDLKSTLAEGYRTAGRLDEARAVLEQMITDFGRRRSPERAHAHYQLAQVAHAAGDIKEALDHLDKASSMDLGHAGILRLLGQLAREGGQLDRSERAYRALLLLVRRQSPDSPDVQVGASEVLYELSRLARERGQDAQANELLESAVETAQQSSAEAARFTKVLITRKETELAEKIIAKRLSLDESGLPRAKVLADRAQLLEELKNDPKAALDARIQAMELAPEWTAQVTLARATAQKHGESAKLAEALKKLVERSTRRKDDAPLASDLLMSLADILENDVRDLAAAAEAYQRVEALGVRTVDAWRALSRVAAARGDRIEEIRVLRRLVAAGVDTSTLGKPEDDIPESAKTDALYRIAEVELRDAETLQSGLDTLADAVQRDGDNARAARAAAEAAAQFPTDARSGTYDGLAALWERTARASGDKSLLLGYLLERIQGEGASVDDVREASQVAIELGREADAERVLVKGAEIARASLDGLAGALWIPTTLAERRKAAGDLAGAIRWTQVAVEASDASGDAQRTEQLSKDLAALAAQPGGDPALAAQTYARLIEAEPRDRALWGPAADVFVALRDREGFEQLVRRTLEGLIEPEDRNALRMELAARLMGPFAAQEDAISVLREVLEEDPDHLGASQALADVFERAGRNEELADLLRLQLDRARDRNDATAVAALSLRTGGLYAKTRREDAMEAYRAGLDWAPEDAALLRALYELYGKNDDARDRATLGERLLAVETGEAAAKLALSLADQLTELEDADAALRALDVGFKAAPTHEKLRKRLEKTLRERNDLDALAEMIAFDAAHRDTEAARLTRFREAAALYKNELGAPERAADVLREAAALAPGDLELLGELVDALSQSGRVDDAAEAVRVALDAHPNADKNRARLLASRSGLRLTLRDTQGALEDAEESFRIDPKSAQATLVAALDAHRETLADQGDRENERTVTLRLSSVLRAGGDGARSRDVLAAWVDRDPSDVTALRTLVELDSGAQRWADVVSHATRLIALETGEAQAEMALRLHQAAAEAGDPAGAREGLERALQDQPANPEIRNALRALYESIGAFEELAAVLLVDAQESQGETRDAALRRAGEIYLHDLQSPARAIPPLREALASKEDDLDLLVLLVDALIGSDALAEAVEILQGAIQAKGKKRSPALASLQQRMARIAGLSGDPQTQLEWLKVALETDKQSNLVAAELAELAIQLGDDASAMNALKVVTLQKTPGPMSKAVAFLRQAQIANRQGDHQKAVLWARRARIEDAELREAEEFLHSIGEG
ncbi:MAG: tetratricopeptide repeat protein [Sandaracinus sp.]